MGEGARVILYWKSRRAGRHWHTIQRSPLFVVLPGVVIALFGLNLVWEIIRQNVNEATTQQWPLRFSLVDLATTTNLLAIAGGLMLARAQFAKTVQPNFGYSWTKSDDKTHDWDLHFYNGGPGHAIVLNVLYSVRLGSDQDAGEPDWVELPKLEEKLLSDGLGLADVEMYWLGGGVPITPQLQSRDGFRLGAFSYRALSLMEKLEVQVSAEDQVGDKHTLLVQATNYLPREARDEIRQIRRTRFGSQ